VEALLDSSFGRRTPFLLVFTGYPGATRWRLASAMPPAGFLERRELPPAGECRRAAAMARVNWPLVCSSGSMSKITEASRDHIADENFAFPKERKEPIHDAAHVRNAIARFKQVQGWCRCC
jgi:hypothetical protein